MSHDEASGHGNLPERSEEASRGVSHDEASGDGNPPSGARRRDVDVTIGVLALQGDFDLHRQVLGRIGVAS
ncbi:MAG: hypothetical protein HYS36_06180, partial [Candidatus Rokubacteria bacterium]|nr:hypothetical protein [Candidatus Rokubacteria bacterium]